MVEESFVDLAATSEHHWLHLFLFHEMYDEDQVAQIW